MNVLKKRIAVLMGEVTTKCAILTATTKHDFFFEFQAHVGKISVYVHINGWSEDNSISWINNSPSSIECNINCNNDFMSSDDTKQFECEWHDAYSIKQIEDVIVRLGGFLSGDIEVNQENIERPLTSYLEF